MSPRRFLGFPSGRADPRRRGPTGWIAGREALLQSLIDAVLGSFVDGAIAPMTQPRLADVVQIRTIWVA